MKKIETHATHVGSGPRPKSLLMAKTEYDKGELTEEEFEAILNIHVRQAVRIQLEAGLKQVNDFEFGRFVTYFGNITGLKGFRQNVYPMKWPSGDVIMQAMLEGEIEYDEEHSISVIEVGRVKSFLEEIGSDAKIKVTVPAPGMVEGNYPSLQAIKAFTPIDPAVEATIAELEAKVKNYYPSLLDYLKEIARIVINEVKGAIKAGASVIQLDSPDWIGYAGPDVPESVAAEAFERKLSTSNLVLSEIPPSVETHYHICWGNVSNALLVTAGSYRTNKMLDFLYKLKVDVLGPLMVCDNLRDDVFLKDFQESPPPQEMGLAIGILDKSTRTLEPVEVLVKRARPYAELVGFDRLYLAPSCGFESGVGYSIHDLTVVSRKLTNLVKAAKKLEEGY